MNANVSGVMNEAGAGGLDRVAHRVHPHHRHPARRQRSEHLPQVRPAPRVGHVDVDLLGRERRPHQPPRPVRVGHRRERQPRPGSVDPQQLLFRHAVRVDAAEGQEHPCVGRVVAPREPVPEGRGVGADVVHDRVRHHLVGRGQRPHVVPPAQPRVDGGVVDRVEPCVGAVERREERQHVHAGEHPRQRAVQQRAQAWQRPREAVGVGDQVGARAHRGWTLSPRGAADPIA